MTRNMVPVGDRALSPLSVLSGKPSAAALSGQCRRGLNETSSLRSRLDLTLDDSASFQAAVQLGCGRFAAVLLRLGARRLADAYGMEFTGRWSARRRCSSPWTL
jgi:hypothetical protein